MSSLMPAFTKHFQYLHVSRWCVKYNGSVVR